MLSPCALCSEISLRIILIHCLSPPILSIECGIDIYPVRNNVPLEILREVTADAFFLGLSCVTSQPYFFPGLRSTVLS
jgi:hypothetical protein